MVRSAMILSFLCIFLIGCSTQSQEYITVPALYASNAAQDTNTARQITELDRQVYSYLESVWSRDKKSPSKDLAVANGLLAASKEFKKPIVEVYYIYALVANDNAKIKHSEREIAGKIVPDLIDMGFKNVGDKWYFKNKAVDFGQLPVANDSKSEASPKIDVCFNVNIEVSALHYVKVSGSTNLPDTMTVLISINNKNFHSTYQTAVKYGKFESNWISDPNQAGSRMAPGKYTLEISSLISNIEDPNTRLIIGPLGRNLTGIYVKFSPKTGNKVVYTKDFTIE